MKKLNGYLGQEAWRVGRSRGDRSRTSLILLHTSLLTFLMITTTVAMATAQQETDTESTRSKIPTEPDDQPHEFSPLLPKRTQDGEEKKWGKSVVLRLLLTSTLVSLSFGVTQVP